MTDAPPVKPLAWVGPSLKDFRAFADKVKSEMGYALYVAQCGGRYRKAKTLKGMGGAGVVELIGDHQGNTYRTVYTVRFETAIYVLHAFQKKSKSGIATPQTETRLIGLRMRDAERMHKESQS